jgi:hypothetical protein
MTKEDQLIADQAKQLWDANERIKRMKYCLDTINKSLICIGGPLNDNNLNYTNEQLALFFRIQRLTAEDIYD